MNNKFKISLMAITAGVIALVSTPGAHAVPTITLTSGATTVTVVDNVSNDNNTDLGSLSWEGSVGAFTFTLTSGVTYPVQGTQSQPKMTLNSTDVSSLGGGSLTISFIDTFTGPTNNSIFTEIGGATFPLNGGTTSVTYTTYLNGVEITSQGPLSSVFATSASGFINSVNYTLEQRVVITHSGPGQTSFGATLSVPDGGSTVALLGCSFLGLAYVRNRFALLKA